MGSYIVNKLLWHIDRDDEALEAYRSDPKTFVSDWERSTSSPQPPYPDGGILTAEERDAFVGMEASDLYSLGAHPYLLWHYVRAVLLETDMTTDDLSDVFKAGISGKTPPDLIDWTATE